MYENFRAIKGESSSVFMENEIKSNHEAVQIVACDNWCMNAELSESSTKPGRRWSFKRMLLSMFCIHISNQ